MPISVWIIGVLVCVLIQWYLVAYIGLPVWVLVLVGILLILCALLTRDNKSEDK